MNGGLQLKSSCFQSQHLTLWAFFSADGPNFFVHHQCDHLLPAIHSFCFCVARYPGVAGPSPADLHPLWRASLISAIQPREHLIFCPAPDLTWLLDSNFAASSGWCLPGRSFHRWIITLLSHQADIFSLSCFFISFPPIWISRTSCDLFSPPKMCQSKCLWVTLLQSLPSFFCSLSVTVQIPLLCLLHSCLSLRKALASCLLT